MKTNENITVLLAARAAAYRILQNIFGNEPNMEGLNSLNSQASRDVLGLVAEGENPSAPSLFLAVERCLQGKEEQLDQLKVSFTRLFVGPGNMEAPPWESLYLSKESSLFQASTLEVRKAYVAQGFIAQSYPNVADDHIGLELDFMARLAEKAAESFSAGDTVVTKEYLIASASFLDQHLLVWIPLFVAVLTKADHADFYREAGAVLEELLSVDQRSIQEVLSAIE